MMKLHGVANLQTEDGYVPVSFQDSLVQTYVCADCDQTHVLVDLPSLKLAFSLSAQEANELADAILNPPAMTHEEALDALLSDGDG